MSLSPLSADGSPKLLFELRFRRCVRLNIALAVDDAELLADRHEHLEVVVPLLARLRRFSSEIIRHAVYVTARRCLNYHKAVGFSILIPVALRIVWRFVSPPPRLPDSMPGWQRRVSGLSHFLLYFLLLAMPLTGYFGNGGGVDYGFFRVPPFSSTALSAWLNDSAGFTFAQQDTFFDAFHYSIVGPYIFWVLILFHASAAVWHHVVQKDDILKRMLAGTCQARTGF